MKRNIIIATLLLIIITCIGVYFYFDGLLLYKIQKMITPPLELIEFYINKDLPDETKIDSMEFIAVTDPQYSEELFAKLILPKNAIDTLFPEKERNYSEDDFYLYKNENNQSELVFRVNKGERVRRTRFVMTRNIEFSIYEPRNDMVDVSVMVTNLGYYRYK